MLKKSSDHHIEVFPNIPGVEKNRRKVDPDVENIINKSKNSDGINVMDMPHEPTDEEKTNSKHADASWSWLIMGLGFIVILLIIIIVWYVLRENEEPKPVQLPMGITRPAHSYNPGQMHPGQMHPGQMHPGQMHPGQPFAQNPFAQDPFTQHSGQQRPQFEHTPINSQTMQQKEKETQKRRQPTKEELENTLQQLTGKDEENSKMLTPSKRQRVKENTGAIVEEMDEETAEPTDESAENQQLDNKLTNTFYTNLQQNIDLEDLDDEKTQPTE
jgi:hypothetical protein